MKNLFYLVLAVFFFSCGKKDKVESEVKESKPDTSSVSKQTQNVQDTNKKIYGYYVGGFEAVKFDETKNYVYSNKITISLDSIRGENFFGHSVVAGNNRPFKGTYSLLNNNYVVQAAEPGDDKYDGKFSFTVYPESYSLKGKWKAYNGSISVTEREYSLEKRDFKYNPSLKLPEEVSWQNLYDENQNFFQTEGSEGEFLTSDVLKVNPSSKQLSKTDIENMHKGDLEIIRNSIYARHGYSFKNRKIRFIFDRFVPWYMPISTDVSRELTEIELKNIDLLKRYEQHAEKYYDSFGR
ncbi:MAG: YARHG domain-containing protein [Ignavibacteria bacterium]|nr:YARHG domain-containing protein [Ignavibacteria bacterium]